MTPTGAAMGPALFLLFAGTASASEPGSALESQAEARPVEVAVEGVLSTHNLQPVRVGTRVSIPFEERTWFEVTADVSATGHGVPGAARADSDLRVARASGDVNFQSTLTWARGQVGLDLGRQLATGGMSVADEAALRVSVAGVLGVRAVWLRDVIMPATDGVGVTFTNRLVHFGPSAGGVVRFEATDRLLVRADVHVLGLVQRGPRFAPDAPPPARNVVFWPSVGLGLAYRIGATTDRS